MRKKCKILQKPKVKQLFATPTYSRCACKHLHIQVRYKERCVVLTSEPLNPVVLVIIPKCSEGKHGNMQNMAMDGSRRGSMGREEREREVVVVSQTLFFFTPASSSSSSSCIRKCLLESLIHRFLHLSSPLFLWVIGITSLLGQMRSFPNVRCHVCRAWSCRASHLLIAVSHCAIGVVQIHAGHVLSHLKATKHP